MQSTDRTTSHAALNGWNGSIMKRCFALLEQQCGVESRPVKSTSPGCGCCLTRVPVRVLLRRGFSVGELLPGSSASTTSFPEKLFSALDCPFVTYVLPQAMSPALGGRLSRRRHRRGRGHLHAARRVGRRRCCCRCRCCLRGLRRRQLLRLLLRIQHMLELVVGPSSTRRRWHVLL